MENVKPSIFTGIIALVAVALIYAASPDLGSLTGYRYAFLVPIFTATVAVSSLYFIHSKLSEVIS